MERLAHKRRKREAAGSEPERTCIATRARLSPDDLIRFVAGPDGTIVPDVAQRLPGRGVWVGLSRAAVEKAARQNAFARSLKRPVVVPEGLPSLVEGLLRRRALDALSIANKAGLAVAGFVKVETLLATGEVAALVHAADGAADGTAKLGRRLRAVTATIEEIEGGAEPAPIIDWLTSTELSLALGRQNVVHAALRAGGATTNFLREAGRLKRYLADSFGEPGKLPQSGFNTEQA
jgi:hypothetical protein